MDRSVRCWIFTCLLGMGFALAAGAAVGQEFRVETEVTFGRDAKTSESLTLFAGDVVYDLVLGTAGETSSEIVETTIFDVRRGKLVLLDPARQVRTLLTTEQLLEFSAEIKKRGSQQVEQAAFFQPDFELSYNSEQLLLTLSSERLTYRARGQAARSPDAAQRFRQFADWYARLNAMRPGNLPPFGRLELNKALAERELIPQEIERTTVLDRPVGSRTQVVTAKHTVTWLLSGTDRRRIEEAGKQNVNFREVAPQEYWASSLPKSAGK